MKNTIKLLIFVILYVLPFYTTAQTYKAEARADTNQLLIGDQIKVDFSYSGDIHTQVVFPFLCDTCLPGLEVLKRSSLKTDTTNETVNYHQSMIITSFDSGLYTIPAISFYDQDSIFLATTQPIPIRVKTLVVDTSAAIKDIKPPLTVPLTLKELLPFLLLGILAIILIIAGIYVFKRIKRKKTIFPSFKEKPKIPAHITALEALENLRLKKLWQQGEFKLYYSELTGILRTYLEQRWSIQAMEMVSEEIIDALHKQKIEQSLINNLQFTLGHADMVKFAKGQPLPDENQLSFNHVLNFVTATKKTQEESTSNNHTGE